MSSVPHSTFFLSYFALGCTYVLKTANVRVHNLRHSECLVSKGENQSVGNQKLKRLKRVLLQREMDSVLEDCPELKTMQLQKLQVKPLTAVLLASVAQC